MHFWRLAAFVAPFGRFFHDLGRSSLDFGAPSWPYVGTHFALDGIFRHAAGIAAKKPCWHSLSAFRFHYAARRYVRSTWNWRFKTLQNEGRNPKKSMLKINTFLALIFQRFGRGFGRVFGKFFEAKTHDKSEIVI